MNERLKMFVNYLILNLKVKSNAELATKLGIAKSQFSEILTGKRKVSTVLVNEIHKMFPELNKDWLATGTGEMVEGLMMPQSNSSEEDSKELQILAKLVNSLQDTVATQKALITIYETEIKRLQRAVQFKDSGRRAASALPDSEEF